MVPGYLLVSVILSAADLCPAAIVTPGSIQNRDPAPKSLLFKRCSQCLAQASCLLLVSDSFSLVVSFLLVSERALLFEMLIAMLGNVQIGPCSLRRWASVF